MLAMRIGARVAIFTEEARVEGSTITGGTPEQLAVMLKSEMAKWGKLIKDAGIGGE